jgi:hypothetical protein
MHSSHGQGQHVASAQHSPPSQQIPLAQQLSTSQHSKPKQQICPSPQQPEGHSQLAPQGCVQTPFTHTSSVQELPSSAQVGPVSGVRTHEPSSHTSCTQGSLSPQGTPSRSSYSQSPPEHESLVHGLPSLQQDPSGQQLSGLQHPMPPQQIVPS